MLGKNFWQLEGIKEPLDIPCIIHGNDGPHGLRKQPAKTDHLGLNQSVKATCFPPAVTSASSWDRSCSLYEIGQAIGEEECVQEEVAVILGPEPTSSVLLRCGP